MLAVVLLQPLPIFAHTYHTSLTRMDYNAEKSLLEITIRVFNHDLRPVLEKVGKRSIDLGSSPGVDDLIRGYFKQNFEIKDKNGLPLEMNWVGKELENDRAFLYFEIPTKEIPEGYSVKNSIFFESFKKQTNLIVLRAEKKKCDLVFVVGDSYKQLSFERTQAGK